jgi:hypothetical protein
MQILRSNSIPNANTWAQTAAAWLNRPPANITSNPRNFTRLYLVDPAISLPTANPGVSGYLYAQTGNIGLTNPPLNARILLVSTIARTNPPPSIDFNETWNWNPVQNPNAKPASWTAFPGTGNDVCIQRLNLGPMFYQLILVNRDQNSASTNAPFNINGYQPLSPAIVTNGIIWNNYYFAGSVVGLYPSNNPPNPPTVATTYILARNSSFVFENGIWNGQILDASTTTNPPAPTSSDLADAFSAAAVAFFKSSWNGNAGTTGGKSASQSAVLGAFANFMLDYTMWADTTPSFNANGAKPITDVPVYKLLTSEQNNVNIFSGTDQGNNSGLLHH